MSGWPDTSDLKAALPEESHGNGTQTGKAAEEHPPAMAKWVAKTENNYSEAEDHAWAADARVYKWNGEEGEGDVGPIMPDLEAELFGIGSERDPRGIDFTKIESVVVTQEGEERIERITSFKNAGLHTAMERNVVDLYGYKTPTPIQQYCVPAINKGYDLLAVAQTGSGKTAAYLIPILNRLMGKAKKLSGPRPENEDDRVCAEPLVVIVVPARELAVQIFNETRKFCYRTMLRPCVAYGGGPLGGQIDNLQKGCDVLISSPGRLIDLMERPRVLSLRRVKFMVIDEADEMLKSDWEEDFNKILCGGEQDPGAVQYMLFSATFPTAVRKLAKTHLRENYVRIKVGRIGSTHSNITQDVIYVEPSLKKKALIDLLNTTEKVGRYIVFVNSKRTADDIDDFLFNQNLPSTSMHADRTQREREDAMRAFRSGTVLILVATGVMARGIDVPNVVHVINYDLPSMDHGGIDEYIHRIGRTGRIGHRGNATSFYTERDEPIAKPLVMTLMETGQEVPDFLEPYKPDETDVSKFKFEYDTDEEAEGDGGDSWGAGGAEAGDGGGWGAGNGHAEDNGWGGPTNDNVAAAGGNDGWGAPAGADNGFAW